MKRLMPLLLYAGLAAGQSPGPSVTPASLSFSYQVNSSSFPAPAKLTASLPAPVSALPMTVTVASNPQGWLTVTPNSGHSPLTLSVTVNPTTLTPGSYSGTITIDTVPASSNPAVVPVSLSVSNAPSTLMVTSPSPNYSPPSGSSTPTLTFTYTTGSAGALPTSAELDVASSGDIIPFNVTASAGSGKTGSGSSAVWLRVNGSGQLPNLQTSGVALSGSTVPITITLDSATLNTLNPGSYAGLITIAATNPVNGSATVAVNLVVSAGPPTLHSIFPSSIIAGPAINPVITIYGDNFFSTSVVTIQQGSNPAITVPSVLLSRQVLQATVNAVYFAAAPGASYPVTWVVAVTNPAPPNNPSQAPATTLLTITDPTMPGITSVVNSASYLPAAVQTGTAANPVPANATAVSPREIISIFGQNLGPATVTATSPTGSPAAYPTIANGIQVLFTYGSPPTTIAAPLIVTSSNQINCIVPVELASQIGKPSPNAVVVVTNGTASTAPFPLTVISEDPGVFAFGGLGQGQGAILNFDSSSGSYTINSAKSAAPRGSPISIYATGLGDLTSPPVTANGEVASSAITLADNTARVDIAGQPAVVTYAGAAPGAVAGLVQINAIVPPTVPTGAAVPITVSIGSASTSRRSQPGVTIAVK
ncbi:MAG TPA: hypothetical protein VKX45_11715 [Bryobacteraceae bacterium]|nr:hypothetical protein [Bryobacteraceae bacterium]